MSEKITVYQKPTCTKCREVDKMLREAGVNYDKINYYTDPIAKGKLKELISKLGINAGQLLRTTEPIYKQLKLSGKELSEEQLIDLMVKHPDLLQRPIVEKGNRAVLGRPASNILPLLK